MISLSDFHTRETANEGIKLPLSLPDGTKTDHFLMVRGMDSDHFRRENIKQQRELLDLSKLPESEREERLENSSIQLIASLVSGWSFDEPCTKETVVEFLKNAPQITDMIDRIAGQRGLFVKKKPKNSTGLPVTKSNSARKSKAQTSARKRTTSK